MERSRIKWNVWERERENHRKLERGESVEIEITEKKEEKRKENAKEVQTGER